MIVRLGFALLLAVLTALTLRSLPDLARYLKIREM